MRLIYDLAIRIYHLFIKLASPVNEKAAHWINGRKGLFKALALEMESAGDEQIAWFHCASLGEFEQGRPLIEAFRNAYPNSKILLTFFSPSGYEIRKNYEKAHWIFYL